MKIETIIQDIMTEHERAKAIAGNVEMDKQATQNDYIAFIIAYLGRASRGVFRNERENQEYYTNMVKAAGLIIAALENRA